MQDYRSSAREEVEEEGGGYHEEDPAGAGKQQEDDQSQRWPAPEEPEQETKRKPRRKNDDDDDRVRDSSEHRTKPKTKPKQAADNEAAEAEKSRKEEELRQREEELRLREEKLAKKEEKIRRWDEQHSANMALQSQRDAEFQRRVEAENRLLEEKQKRIQKELEAERIRYVNYFYFINNCFLCVSKVLGTIFANWVWLVQAYFCIPRWFYNSGQFSCLIERSDATGCWYFFISMRILPRPPPSSP